MLSALFAGCGEVGSTNDDKQDTNQTTDNNSNSNSTDNSSNSSSNSGSSATDNSNSTDNKTEDTSKKEEDKVDNKEEDKTQEKDTSTTLSADTKIYVVGDSTVCAFSDDYYLPRYGYGTQLYNYLDLSSASQVVNLALSGRSSKSFLTEDNYTTLTSSIKSGDYLIIGFGHNDEKSDDSARYTNPTKSYTDDTTTDGVSFQYNLYQNYIKMAVDKGATPILCTPIARYNASGNYTGTSGHVTSDGDYPAAIRTLAEATNTALVDLTALTIADYTAKGTEAQYYHAHTTYTETTSGEKTPDGIDTTHINKYGAKMVAYEFATALKGTNCALKNSVKTNITAPTKETDYKDAINTSYVKPDYTPFKAADYESNLLTTVGGTSWYKTVMGDVGGDDKISKFSVTYGSDKFSVGNSSGNGKFSATSDGFCAAFVQIDATKNFTASATIKITSMGSSVNNQSGFGIMLRDDMYIDTNSKTITSNYVVAGALGGKSTASSGSAIFSRSSASALTTSSNSVTISTEKTYTATLTRVGQVVTVTFSDGTNSYTQTYTDFDFTAVDNGNMYLCLFANRGIVAEFSDVQFTITGTAQAA
jgi:lysophospholipase L1-like esterase